MISLETVKQYCREYWKIENYQEAVNDTTQTWHCHHRHEIDWALPREELISIGRYYDVHHSELIFLTSEEHNRLHHTGKVGYWKGKECPWKGKVSPHKGHHHTEETKQKMRESVKKRGGHSGKNNPRYVNICPLLLFKYYVLDKMTQHQIATLLNSNQPTISRKLKEYNISNKK